MKAAKLLDQGAESGGSRPPCEGKPGKRSALVESNRQVWCRGVEDQDVWEDDLG